MKLIALILITVISIQVHADKKASQVTNHLRTIGYNGEPIETLPNNKKTLDEWTFSKISDKYYNITSPKGPKGLDKRIYEYTMDHTGVTEITMQGGTQPIYLYKKQACEDINNAPAKIKANEKELLNFVIEILSKYNISGPKFENLEPNKFGVKYAMNCRLIFGTESTRVKESGKKSNK